MIAQMAGKCASLAKPGILPVLGSVKNVKFYRNVNPGDLCVIHAQIEKIGSSYINASGHVEVDGQKVCSASILFGVVKRDKLNSENFDAVTQEWLAKNKQVEETAS